MLTLGDTPATRRLYHAIRNLCIPGKLMMFLTSRSCFFFFFFPFMHPCTNPLYFYFTSLSPVVSLFFLLTSLSLCVCVCVSPPSISLFSCVVLLWVVCFSFPLMVTCLWLPLYHLLSLNHISDCV